MFFEVKGVPRVVETIDRKHAENTPAVSKKADPQDPGSFGASMSGDCVEITVQPGESVKAGQQLVIMSAMKMETAVCAPVSGVIQHIAVVVSDTLEPMDLLVQIHPEDTEKKPAIV